MTKKYRTPDGCYVAVLSKWCSHVDQTDQDTLSLRAACAVADDGDCPGPDHGTLLLRQGRFGGEC